MEIGKTIPDGVLMESVEFGEACPLGPTPVKISEALAKRTVAIFGVPGAYTPTCSAKHVPGFLNHLDDLKAKGVDEVWCVSANDAFVMAAWGRDLGAFGKIRFLGDGSAEWANVLGIAVDLKALGMGTRMQRFSVLVEDGVLRQVNVEPGKSFEVSSAEYMLQQLEAAS